MARTNAGLLTFNRGRISKLALGRVDLDRTRLSAEMQTNWVPRTLGSMMLRPGTQYIGTINNSSTAVLIPFVYSATDTALIELTSTNLRVWIDDALATRLASTSVITNGTFSSSALTGWTSADETGSTSGWNFFSTSTATTFLYLTGTRFSRAIRRQSVTATSGTRGLAIRISRGRVNLRVGSSAGGDDYFKETPLRPGDYSLSITSTGTFHIEVSANNEYNSNVMSVAIESSGPMAVGSTWGSTDLRRLRWDQSADVVFVSCPDRPPKRIERHAAQSWGIAEYMPEDGPFRSPNVTDTRVEASAIAGNANLLADRSLFKSTHGTPAGQLVAQGTLFRVTTVGQEVSVTPSTTNQFSNPIRVAGIGDERKFKILILSSTGFDATIRVQRSVGSTSSFANVTGLQFTSTIDSTHNDTLDNQIIYYRIGAGSTYISGSPVSSLIYESGGITGVVRVNQSTGSTIGTGYILSPLGSTAVTELWEEGSWSHVRGWPTAVALHEGRLWWAGKASIWGSVADAYESFSPDTEGDSGPINRSIASGGVDRVQWLASLGRLIVGAETRELQAKTGALEEPLTPTNFNLRDISSQGSASVPPIKFDNRLLFVQNGQTRLMEISYSGETLDYRTVDRTVLVPEIGEPAIVRMAAQRQPDTRIHVVRADGTVGVLVSEPAEDVAAWIDIATTAANGAVEEVAVLPSSGEDAVYYIVRREINGSTYRYLERWAMESQARGGSSNRMADSFVLQNSTATTIVSGATHLVGSSVIAWGATADLGSYTVSTTGGIVLSQAATTVCFGLPYEAWFKSVKLAYAATAGTALTQKKRVNHIGLILADVHAQGLQFGPSTNSTELDRLPLISLGATVSTDAVNATFDQTSIEFPGSWDTDSRIVLRAVAPRPCTVLGAVIQMETREKI